MDCAKATKDRIKCPAVKLIISRRESVRGRKKHLINSTQDINMAKARAGRFAGVKWEGHQYLVIKELKKGVDQSGKAKDMVSINWVVTVKLKGSKPLRFQDRIAKQVKTKGVVSFLKGVNAEHKVFIVNCIKLFV